MKQGTPRGMPCCFRPVAQKQWPVRTAARPNPHRPHAPRAPDLRAVGDTHSYTVGVASAHLQPRIERGGERRCRVFRRRAGCCVVSPWRTAPARSLPARTAGGAATGLGRRQPPAPRPGRSVFHVGLRPRALRQDEHGGLARARPSRRAGREGNASLCSARWTCVAVFVGVQACDRGVAATDTRVYALVRSTSSGTPSRAQSPRSDSRTGRPSLHLP
jgi:hypothetical protein